MAAKLYWPRLWWGLGFTFVAFILISSLVPVPPLPGSWSDKLQHFIAYGWLGFWFGNLSKNFKVLSARLIGLGVLIECLQYLLPYRSFEWLDILANSVGVLSGLAASLFVKAIAFVDHALHRFSRRA